MKPEALEGVEAQLERGELTEAARALLRAWRDEPHPEVANAIDGFPQRETEGWTERATARMERWLTLWRRDDPLATADLLSELNAMLRSEQARFVTPCFDALAASAPDPRVAHAAVTWVQSVSGVLSPTKPLYRSLEKTVKRHLDPRQLPVLRRLEVEGTPWSSAIGALSTLAGAYAAIARKVQQQCDTLPPMTLGVAARIAALGERAAALPVPAEATKGLLDIDTMLARIREAPDDEAHRAVFRDRLLEASDPWGELIALQEARAKSEGGATARERTLLKQLRARILGSAALEKPSVLSELSFSRGFLTGATVKLKGVTRVAAMLSRPELSLLERVTFGRDCALTPNLQALTQAHGITLEALTQAKKKLGELKLSAVTIARSTLSELTTAQWWPSLRELYAIGIGNDLADMFLLPVAKQLSAVGITDRWALAAFHHLDVAAFRRAPPSIQRVQFDVSGDGEVSFQFFRDGAGWRAELRPARPMRPGHGALPGAFAKLLPEIQRSLQAATEVKLFDGVPAALHALAR